MDAFDVNLIPLVMLISLVYENGDKEILKAAFDFLTKNVKLRKLSSKNSDVYAVKAIKLKEPFLIPELKEGKVEARDLQVKLKMNNVKVLDVGDFTTRKEKKCCLTIDFEFIKITGMYNISGSINGNSFKGNGNAVITLSDVSTETKVDHTFQEEEVKINNLQFDFNFKMLEFEQTGLVIKDVPSTEVRRILNAVGKVYFKQNMKTISRKLSATVRDRFNELLKGKNRDQIVELLHRGHFKL
ncbi:uncharacterized protein LOC135839987 [Planococcus citri]|uniref:uncharacterized protein LOC135839987 n=1 Tax=Planococcus citri TaxID=170843 RepID=UPI0031F86A7E